MKIIFFGTPNFVIPIVESLTHVPGCQLVAVVTNPDKPVGREQNLTPSPIKQWAMNKKIQIIDSALMIYIIKAIKEIRPDLGILAAYGKIIPQEIIDLFPKGILVLHPSLLPKYRGASPIQAAILAGDKETGVTILKMDAKMDHGPIVSQFTETINADDTTGTLTTRLFGKTAEVLSTVLNDYIENKITPREQDHEKASYCQLLKKDDGKINWQWPPEKIERFIRAMTPWPGAFTHATLNMKHETLTKRLKILKAHVEASQVRNHAAKLILDLVQLEGKKPVSWKEFQKGYPEAKFI